MIDDDKKTLITGAENFKKTNDAIGLRVSRGHLSFVSRKVFNVFVLHAQKLGAPGVNAPIQSETAHKYFWVPLSEIQKDTDYNSNDTKLLKESLEELQDIKITSQTDKEWTSERLLASVKLVNPSGLNKKGGRVWVGFEFPAEVMSLVMNPRTFTTLSLYYMTVLRTNAGLALYEAAKKHAWKQPLAMTEKLGWEHWRDYLEGMSGKDMADWKHQYKFFKDRVLKKAIAEVNGLTDIDVELIEHKNGKRVLDLQFKVTKKTQSTLDLPGPPVIDTAIIGEMVDMGLHRKEAEEMFATHSEVEIKSALLYTQTRALSAPELQSPAAYFKKALRDKYATAKPTKKTQVIRTPVVNIEVNDPESASRQELALADYDALPSEEKDLRWNAFLDDNPGAAKAYGGSRRAGLVARKTFGVWLAKEAAQLGVPNIPEASDKLDMVTSALENHPFDPNATTHESAR